MALTNKLKNTTKKLKDSLGPSAANPASGGATGTGSPVVYAPGAPKDNVTFASKMRQTLQSKLPSAVTAGLNVSGDATPVTNKYLSPTTGLDSSSSSSSSKRKYDAFSTSDRTEDYYNRLQDIEGDEPEEFTYDPFKKSALAEDYLSRLQQKETEKPGDFTYDPFKTSARTEDYFNLTKQAEANKPDAFNSRYEGAVQSILDGILNKGNFNLEQDKNYNMLYNQARESYMNAGQKAMRDAMGQAQAQTGGYGSTAAQIAGSQAYDSYLQGMNDNNAALAQLAYQMWQDDNADRYNQLNAVQGLDESDYNRWLQGYRNWADERNYFANQYQQGYANDWNEYQFGTNLDYNIWQDNYNNWLKDREYLANQYQNTYNNDWNEYQYGTNMDYNIWNDNYNHWLANRDYLANQYQQGYANDMNLYQYDTNLAYQLDRDDIEDTYRRERDAISDYDDAFNAALKLAQNGVAIPAQYANRLEPETLLALQGLAGKALAGGSGGSGGSGGGGGSRKRSGNPKKSKDVEPYEGIQREHIMDEMAKQAAISGTAGAYALGESMLALEKNAEGLPYREETASALSNFMDTLSDDTPINKRKYVDSVRNVAKKLKTKR